MSRADFEIYLSEDQWELMIKLLDHEIKKGKAIQRKAIDHPGFTISSDMTLDRYQLKIQELEMIKGKITERLF